MPYNNAIKVEKYNDVDYVQTTFMQDQDALAMTRMFNPDTLTMQNLEVLDTYEPKN